MATTTTSQAPAVIRTLVPLVVGWIVSTLASIGLEVSDDAQKTLATAIGTAAAFAYYVLVRLLEKRWPALGVLLGSAKTPDSYSKGKIVPRDSDIEGEIVDDIDDAPDDETETDSEDSDGEITDDVGDEPEQTEPDATPAAATYVPRHSAEGTAS